MLFRSKAFFFFATTILWIAGILPASSIADRCDVGADPVLAKLSPEIRNWRERVVDNDELDRSNPLPQVRDFGPMRRSSLPSRNPPEAWTQQIDVIVTVDTQNRRTLVSLLQRFGIEMPARVGNTLRIETTLSLSEMLELARKKHVISIRAKYPGPQPTRSNWAGVGPGGF